MNPLLADLPPGMAEECAPVLPLAWLLAGALVRAREWRRRAQGVPMPAEAAAVPLPAEAAAVNEALREGMAEWEEAVRAASQPRSAGPPRLCVRVSVPLPPGQDLPMLCEQLALRDEMWRYVGPWRQSTSYEYLAPAPRSIDQLAAGGEGLSASPLLRVRTTVRPVLRGATSQTEGPSSASARAGGAGLSVTHEEDVAAARVTLRAVPVRADGGCSPLRFVRSGRRSWSRREDAINVVSDAWVAASRRQEGWPPSEAKEAGVSSSQPAQACPPPTARMVAALGQEACSEAWQNHTRLLDELREASPGAGNAPAAATLAVVYLAPVARETLPALVTRQIVTHRMEKELRADWFRLVIGCESRADSYQAAERGLWRAAAQREAHVTRWAAIEPCDMDAWLEEDCGDEAGAEAVSPLLQALALLRPLLTLGLLDVPEGSVLAPAPATPARDPVRTLWDAAFLARGVPPPDVIAAQLPIVRAAAEHLTQGRVCGLEELLAEWGALYQVAGDGTAEGAKDSLRLAPPRAFPTSGSMPRLYRPAPEHSARFVARPKLLLAPDEEARWSWQAAGGVSHELQGAHA